MNVNAKFTTVLLVLIVFLGFALRMHRFDGIAPSNSDEASYLRHARFMITFARKICGQEVPVIDETKTGIWRHVRKEDWSAKPCWLHSGFIAGSMAVFGINDGAGAAVSIVFSMAAVGLCYLIGRQVAGSVAGLSAAAFLAVSFYWMLYSRGMWAEVDAVFFALLGLYLLFMAVRNERRRYLLLSLSGVAAAVGVLCHYRLLYVIAPLGISVALLVPPRKWMLSGLSLAIGFAGALCGAALVFRLAAGAAGPGAPFTGLIGALVERYLPADTGVEQKGVQFSNAIAIGFYFLRNHGWVMTGLTCLGIVISVLNISYDRRYAALLCTGAFVLLVLCFQVWVVARAASLMIPVACILAGIGLATVWRMGDVVVPRFGVLPRSLAIMLACAVLTENVVKDLRLSRNRMGYEAAASILASGDYDSVFVDPEAEILYGWYAPDVPYTSIRHLYGKESMTGIANAAVVCDGQKYHMYPESVRIVTDLERRISGETQLVAGIPNMTTLWCEFLLDGTQAHSLGGMLESVRDADAEDITSIRIYRVRP